MSNIYVKVTKVHKNVRRKINLCATFSVLVVEENHVILYTILFVQTNRSIRAHVYLIEAGLKLNVMLLSNYYRVLFHKFTRCEMDQERKI